MQEYALDRNEYSLIQKFLFQETGISLGENKYAMVKARLAQRLKHYKISSYSDYLKIVQLSEAEKTEFLNQLSTNETYFFREKEHFTFLQKLAENSSSLAVWSAAASQGAEAYTIAMVLASHFAKTKWQVLGTDINTEVLQIAKKALYPIGWLEKIPQQYQKKYCLIGRGQYEGKFLVDPKIMQNVFFEQKNLLHTSSRPGTFDVIFVRNVLLYFNEDTKIDVINNLCRHLRLGGYLIVSMTECFEYEKIPQLEYVKSSIYQKVQ